MTVPALDAILRPRSVAVIGASRKRGTIAAEVFHNLVSSGFVGAVYPINPHSTVVQSVRAYPSIEAVPDEVDLAVIVLPSAAVLEAVESCGRKGVRGLIVITAGFAETGAQGAELQRTIVERVRHYGMRLVGPNCLGVVNADPEVGLNATFAPTFPPHGNVAFSSQSGALGLAILDRARELGVGISSFVSVGNKADVSGNDLIAYWERDPATQVILLYLENLGNPQRFMELARRVSRSKPIAVVKSGRTEAGARAASSHTGALAGMDVAVDALLGQAGVIRTDTIDELFDVAMLLANQPVPRGRRVAILTNAGGPGIMASDACESRGLDVVRLLPETEQRLRAFLPPEASVKNPVDMIASASADAYERALRLLLADPNVDAVLVLFVTPIVTGAPDVASAILRAAIRTQKTIATCFMGKHGVPEAVSSLREGRFPSYAFPEAAAVALARAAQYGVWLAQPEGVLPKLKDVDRDRAARAIGRAVGGSAPDTPEELGALRASRSASLATARADQAEAASKDRWLRPEEVREVLAAYGIPTLREGFGASGEEAAKVAAAIGFPVALKLTSDTITHKSDVGGVVLGLTSEEAVLQAFAAIEARLGARRGEMRGVLIQEMVPGGVETFVGATWDSQFGHLIGFGIGGVNVELWKDVVFRVAPLRDTEARAMIDCVRARALLEGFRGGPEVDKDAIKDVILRVSRLVHDFPDVLEVDVNPLTSRGEGVVAIDARIRVAR